MKVKLTTIAPEDIDMCHHPMCDITFEPFDTIEDLELLPFDLGNDQSMRDIFINGPWNTVGTYSCLKRETPRGNWMIIEIHHFLLAQECRK